MRRILPVFVVVLIPLPDYAADSLAQAVGVSDGDMLMVLITITEKTQVKLRLPGFDAPEAGRDPMAFGLMVTILGRGEGRHGRTVAGAFPRDGRSLGRELVGRVTA